MDRLIAAGTVAAGQADVAPATGTPGYATDGNPAANVPASEWPAYQYNAIQEELMAIIAAASIAPDRTKNNLVVAAIRRLLQITPVLADTGAVNAYAAANPTPLTAGASPTWVDGVVQAVKIAHTNTGASTYAPDGLAAIPIYGLGLQPLQGGELLLNSTAIMMHMTVAGVNGGNPVCVLMECGGGAQQVAPATQSQHAAQLGQTALPLAGQFWNLNAAFANAVSNAITIDEVIVASALGGSRALVSGWNGTIATNAPGIGGMDIGTVTGLTDVAIFAAYNPTTGAKGFFGQNVGTNGTAGSTYTGANAPAGFTMTCLVAVVLTDSTGKFAICQLTDRHCSIPQNNQVTTGTPSTNTVLALGCPLNARTVDLFATFTCSQATNANVAIAGKPTGNFPVYSFPVNGQSGNMNLTGLYLTTPRTVYYTMSSTAASPATNVLSIALCGWSI